MAQEKNPVRRGSKQKENPLVRNSPSVTSMSWYIRIGNRCSCNSVNNLSALTPPMALLPPEPAWMLYIWAICCCIASTCCDCLFIYLVSSESIFFLEGIIASRISVTDLTLYKSSKFSKSVIRLLRIAQSEILLLKSSHFSTLNWTDYLSRLIPEDKLIV